MTEHSVEHQTLVSALSSRGFEVERPLQSTLNSSIFCVREVSGCFTTASGSFGEGCRGGPFVAKVVSLGGLDAQSRASALQEVSVLRGLESHPNLIQYRDSFLEEAAKVLLIVMSFAENGDLRNVVSTAQTLCRPVPEPAILWWLRQMLTGLAHLHLQGVVHRDLKSSNIFLCEGMSHIRIGDFGISKVLESTNFADTCVGTPAYMSPELMRNERYDYHVDMWALGCVCYELCTLHLPFVSKSLLELVHLVVETEPDWSRWHTDYSTDVREIALRLLSKDAMNRPTADEILAEPLFQAGGRGFSMPSEEVWSAVPMCSYPADVKQLPKDESTRFSEASTADTTEDLMRQSGRSGSETWTMTPRMPWEKSQFGDTSDSSRSAGSVAGIPDVRHMQTVPSCFGQILLQAQDVQRQFSKTDGLLAANRGQTQIERRQGEHKVPFAFRVEPKACLARGSLA